MTTTVEIIWDTHYKLIIRDVHEKWHDRVRNFMLEKYFIPHRLFNQMNYQDDPNVNAQYMKYLQHILRDECSIVVLHEETNDIHAVALMKCMSTEWHSWTALELCIDNSKFADIIDLQCRLIKEFATEFPEEPIDSLHLFEYYVEEDLKYDPQFMGKFFNAIYETARHMKMARLTFVAMSHAEQDECFEEGFDRLSRAIYSIYTQDNRRPFAALRDIDEMEAGLFELLVEPLVPYYEMKVRGIDDVVVPKEDQKKQAVAEVQRKLSIASADD